jgi:hypothetical protein
MFRPRRRLLFHHIDQIAQSSRPYDSIFACRQGRLPKNVDQALDAGRVMLKGETKPSLAQYDRRGSPRKFFKESRGVCYENTLVKSDGFLLFWRYLISHPQLSETIEVTVKFCRGGYRWLPPHRPPACCKLFVIGESERN